MATKISTWPVFPAGLPGALIPAEQDIIGLQLDNATGAVDIVEREFHEPFLVPLHRAIQESIAREAQRHHRVDRSVVRSELYERAECRHPALGAYLERLAWSAGWTEATAEGAMRSAIATWRTAVRQSTSARLLLANARSLRRVAVKRSDSLTPTAIEWLWPGWLARGKLHLIAGAPGTGKTTIALSLAATLSRGTAFADGHSPPIRSTIIWSGEDDLRDTLLPRFMAAGGDRARFFTVDHVRDAKGGVSAFDPARDFPGLEATAAEISDLGLIIVDPIVAAVRGSGLGNAGTRRSLRPLVDLAEKTGAAILGVTHFTKRSAGRDPWERVIGSTAFAAAARCVWSTVKSDEDGEQFRLVRAKSNFGPSRDGFSYALVQKTIGRESTAQAQTIEWGEPVFGGARELIGEVEIRHAAERPSALGTAENWLREALASGPVRTNVIVDDGAGAGIAARTLWRAKASLGVRATWIGHLGGWAWALPPPKDSANDGEAARLADLPESPGATESLLDSR